MSSSEPFSIHALELGPMENFIYLIHDHASGRAAVVDPAWDVPEVLALADSRGMRITDILLTHSHHDHINGISEVLEKNDAQLHLMKSEAQFWGNQMDLPTLHHGGDVIALGDTAIKALHTPGHTPGSACYHIGNELITGDTLFVFGCGRCDL
ncbi:MAG TPA: MBL fold metallo-hydrolase, partial [Gammaproteobacteria bacterium]|nr:MBL fold metallo-hydrolase [Gammaproteobacteria bacterium]